MKRLILIVFAFLFLFGCVQEVEKPSPTPLPTVAEVPSPVPSPVIAPSPTPVPSAYAAPRDFYFGLSDVKYYGNTLEFTFGGVEKESAVYVVGVTIKNVKGKFDSVKVARGESGRVVARSLPYCGAQGTEFKDVQVIISYNPFGGMQGKFDIGFISGVCGSSTPQACAEGVKLCPDKKTQVSRDPNNNCNFFACPAFVPSPVPSPSPLVCTTDVMECADGSFVARNPGNNCNFMPCP
ncbi:MAG: hypothetical protein V1834_03745 [Candidatus Micrarchaeota archaeon]